MGDGSSKEGVGYSPTDSANDSLRKLRSNALKVVGFAAVAALGAAGLAAIF